MAAVPALALSSIPLFAAFGISEPKPAPQVDKSAKLRESLETLFPDVLLYGTRNGLLGMTTSLTKVSSLAQQYFSRVAQILAFERMMRSFMRLTAAVSPFPMDFAVAHWARSLFPVHPQVASPWAFLAPPRQEAASPWAAYFGQPQPRAPMYQGAAGVPAQASALSPWAACFATRDGDAKAAPATILDAFFAATLQPHRQAQAASQPQLWPDYSALWIVPVALVMAAPAPESWWNFSF